jgi:hypothetical protein
MTNSYLNILLKDEHSISLTRYKHINILRSHDKMKNIECIHKKLEMFKIENKVALFTFLFN